MITERKIIGFIAALLKHLSAFSFILLLLGKDSPNRNPLRSELPVSETDSLYVAENFPDAGVLPLGKLIVTENRRNYSDGDMTLVIPKLGIDVPVWNGTSEQNLAKGACLYEYSQTAADKDGNVSIAAHRNGIKNGRITELLFYSVDTLTYGDTLTLNSGGKSYLYDYSDTTVVKPDDWSPLFTRGCNCVTLISCDPIGVSTHRIAVRFILRSVSST